ncbi:acyl carrier protein [Aspergillus nomiae NRRL 13137]|uniref:Acyl carrier protein n=1 Tax=Aspergillus nomiae NRRL (strain ATCC 15546 / NRRL 13137 / CBS 260.88 / M93) TaxID=1509407 RepID=A0A0L1J6I1_ASPN3|nr:acyl carrier protein [Aspergillus nomiae NRRL 13137]KNG87349.1 acyl carrier protein [Aspergillus nomiae NRRL 13137]
MPTIEERVKKVVADQLDKRPEAIKNDASFVGDLGADSLDTVELIMQLEEEFGMEIKEEDAEHLKTVQDAIDYIRNNQQ